MPEPVTNGEAGLSVRTKINQAFSDLAAFVAALAGKADSAHGHAVSDVSGLQTALDGKIDLASAPEITARLTSLNNTDDTIFYRAGVPYLVAASVIADYVGAAPAATAPAVMTAGQWTVVPITGGLRFDIDAAPSDGGSPITGYQYSTDNGATWTAFSGGAALGTRDITGLAATTLQNRVRAVNAVGPAPDPGSDTKTETPGASGGGAAAYLSSTYNPGTDSITITRPAGAGASHELTAIVYTDLGGFTLNTMPAPSGWVEDLGATNPAEGRSARVFKAPGDVSNLTFAQTGIRGVVCFATTAGDRNIAFEGVDYSGPSNTSNRNAPAATAALNDLGVSVFIQVDAGTEGAPADPGSPQAGWTRQYLRSSALPYISILSRDALAAGSTGPVSHDMLGNNSSRFVFTGTYGT